MTILLPLLVATALAGPADDASAAPRGGWFRSIRYAIGFSFQVGGGRDDAPFGAGPVLEPAAFELWSMLAPRFAWHTTLDVGRMLGPAIRDGEGRIDYDLHLAGHVPVGDGTDVVVAPGAAIAYGFTGSRYQRIVGDARLGLAVTEGIWTTAVFLRPYAGWAREVGAETGHVTGGVLVEVAGMVWIPKRAKRR